MPKEASGIFTTNRAASVGSIYCKLRSVLRYSGSAKSQNKRRRETDSLLALVPASAVDRLVFRIHRDHAREAVRRLGALAGAGADQKIALLRRARLGFALSIVRFRSRGHSES